MTSKERWTIILILTVCLSAAIFLALQPAVTERKITLVAGAVLLPLVVLRTGLLTWDALGKRRFVLATLGMLLTGLLILGLLGEWGKLLAVFAG